MFCLLFLVTVLMTVGCQADGNADNAIMSPVPAFATIAPAPEPRGPHVIIGDVEFGTLLAHTPALRTKGLSGRPMLTPQTGMLFIFENNQTTSFWMKGMQIPLDFVWIGADCTVVDITENAPFPEPGTADFQLPRYRSSVPSAYTFEINAGEIEQLGIEIGDTVRFEEINVENATC